MSRSRDILLDRQVQERIATALEVANSAPGSSGFTITHTFPAKDFGDGWTEKIQTPVGFRGIVRAVAIQDVTEAINAVTTSARVDIGEDGGASDEYAIGDDIGAVPIDGAITVGVSAGATDIIPVNQSLIVTGVSPTGGTPTGIATVSVIIAYFV